MASCWSQLPTDLLLSILSKLPVIDIIRSPAVCTAWLAVVNEFRSDYLRRRCLQSPWLLFSKDDGAASFYSVSEGEFYTIRHPLIRDVRRFVGSSHGWLFVLDGRSELRLFNPITGTSINLPSVQTFDYAEAIHGQQGRIGNDIEFKEFGTHCYDKAILSSDPFQKDYTAVLLHSRGKGFSIVRDGDEEWMTIAPHAVYVDVIFHKGQLYTATVDSQLQVWDVSQRRPVIKQTISAPSGFFSGYYSLSYLVQTPRGDLLHILRTTAYFDKLYDPRFAYAFKVDIERGCHVQTHEEEYAMFVGDNLAFCLPSKEFFPQETSKLLIYFTYDWGEWHSCFSRFSRKVAVSRWEDGKFSYMLPYFETPRYMIPPIWITPTL